MSGLLSQDEIEQLLDAIAADKEAVNGEIGVSKLSILFLLQSTFQLLVL